MAAGFFGPTRVIQDTPGTWLGACVPHSLRTHPKWSRIEHWTLKLGEFFLSQGLLQILSALGGFLLLRWMAVEEYAAFTLAFAIQSSMIAFVDVGFSGAIVPLVGSRTGDRAVIGAYVAAARQLRRWLLPFVLAGGMGAFWILGQRQHLGIGTIITLFLFVAVTLWFNSTSVLYGAPIVIKQELRYLQGIQNTLGVLRVGGYAVAHAAGWLWALFALGLNTLLMGANAGSMRRKGKPMVDEPPPHDPASVAARREILRFVRPQVPVMIFNAFQGQLIVFVVAVFGTGASLAETGALSRLNLVFSVTPFFFGWILQPYFARMETALVVRRFWQLILLGVSGLAMAPLAGFFVPVPFLWLLGANYGHLEREVGLILLSGSIGASVGLVSTLMLARRWIFADAIVWIALLTVGFQAIAAANCDVTRPAGALWVMISGNTGSLLAYFALAVRGQRRRTLDTR